MSNFLDGFKPLKEDKIHLKCPKCGRKQSNNQRQDYDPDNAVLMEVQCPRCAEGDFADPIYFDANGEQIMGPYSGLIK